MSQQNALLAEIRSDQKALTNTRTVSSMGDELKISYGTYAGSQNGWNAYISLYSDGILLYTDNFIVNYEALSGKKAPDMETELDDAVIEEYTNNVDMYNSMLTRGDPIIYFEIDYNVIAEGDDKPSQYKFNFSKIRVINTVNGNVTQTSVLDTIQPRTMNPVWDLKEIVGIVEKEVDRIAEEKRKKEVMEVFGTKIKMVTVPGKAFSILNTEVTQKLYTLVMGSNPSYYNGDDYPVEQVSWFDAIYFCNKLSEIFGYTPVYAVDRKTDVATWNYEPHKGGPINVIITQNINANGFRLPTDEEWKYASMGGQDYKYSGSDILKEVGWFYINSENSTHPVAQKKPNGYGLYDMSGNVWEWCWGDRNSYYQYNRDGNSRYQHDRGGSYRSSDYYDCSIGGKDSSSPESQRNNLGFRIVCSTSN